MPTDYLINPEQILVPVDFSRSSESAILHGLQMAVIFRRGLTLLHVCNKFSRKMFPDNTLQTAKKRLIEIAEIIREQNPGINVCSLTEEGRFAEVITATAENINAIMVVLGIPPRPTGQVKSPRRAVSLMKNSRVPYLMVQEKFPVEEAYQKIVLPLDTTREYKEKVLWASYFSRFYNSSVHILVPSSKDAELQYRINANKRFTEKVFDDFEVECLFVDSKYSIYDMDNAGIEYATSIGSQLVIIMNTAFYSMFDYLLGPPEQKLIVNKRNVSVLCINPRDDLYVMCV